MNELGFFERISLKLSQMIGSPASLLLHSLIFGGFLILRYFGVVSSGVLSVLTAAVCLEAIYLVIFIQMMVKNNTKGLVKTHSDIEQIQQEEKEAHKLMVNILHLAHQLKTVQQDIDYLKKSGILKRVPRNGHRASA